VGLIAEVCGSVAISPCRSPRLSPCCFWPGLGGVARPSECLRRRPRRPTPRVGGLRHRGRYRRPVQRSRRPLHRPGVQAPEPDVLPAV